MNSGRVVALAGGVGGAKLAVGLVHCLQPSELVVVVNTGDDEEFHGLHVSPDLDTMMYTLSGLSNPVTGWGLEGDTFGALSMLGKYGRIHGSTWATAIWAPTSAGLNCCARDIRSPKSQPNCVPRWRSPKPSCP